MKRLYFSISLLLIVAALSACGRVQSPCVNLVDPDETGYDRRCG